jgi:hypothetical protein
MELKIEYVDIDSIKPYENNPRHNEEAIPYVMNSIKEFGFKNPIIIDKNNVIIAGHTRLESAKRLGMKEVPIIHADDLTEEQVKAFRLADNKVSEKAEWDFNMLDAELANLEINMAEFGFDNLDINVDEFGTEFELPEGEKLGIDKMTLYFANEQTKVIEEAIEKINLDEVETFGNEHKKGNAIYEVVKEWIELKK